MTSYFTIVDRNNDNILNITKEVENIKREVYDTYSEVRQLGFNKIDKETLQEYVNTNLKEIQRLNYESATNTKNIKESN